MLNYAFYQPTRLCGFFRKHQVVLLHYVFKTIINQLKKSKMRKTILCIAITMVFANVINAQSWNVGGNALTGTSKIGSTSNHGVQLITNNQVRLTTTASGKVGIGTTTPTATLQIQKSTLADVLVKSTGNGAQVTIDRSANGYEAVTRYTQTGVAQWKTGLTVNGAGSPDYVIKNEITNTDALTISGNGSNYVNINSGNFTLGSISFLYNTTNDLNIHAYAPINFQSSTPGNILLAYPGSNYKSGNVGIGTNDPSLGKLVVQGSVGQTIAMFRKSSSSAGITIAADWPEIYLNSYYNSGVKAMKAGFGSLIGFDPTTGLMYFRTASTAAGSNNGALTLTNRMTIGPDGKVLINNSFANSTFNATKIAGTDDAASFLGTQHYSHFMFGANENTYIRGGQDASVVVLADAGTQMVGIGTSTPAYKLDVCGTMRAKEVRVATGWCDYVFADDYVLPSLNDVEAYIKANKHLPDVTPGAIIESEGLEVGKTSAQMIKKIEELTLYVIALQKQVDELKKNKDSLR